MPAELTTCPPGIDPGVWGRASWHARARYLARTAPRPADDAAPSRGMAHRHPAACVHGHDLTDPTSWYSPPGRPDRRDCRECRRVRARIRQRQRRAAARTTSTATDRRAAA